MKKLPYLNLPSLFTAYIFLALLFVAHMSNALTYTVTSTLGTTAVGTMRSAIIAINGAGAGPHIINFDPSLVGTECLSVYSNDLTASNVTIDGSTLPGYTCGNPRIALNCDSYNCWQIDGSNVVIRGIRIFGGLRLNGANNQVLGCLFGFEYDNVTVRASGAQVAMHMNSASSTNNIVGGFPVCDRNIFGGQSGSSGYVRIQASGNGNKFYGNYFGTNIAGLAPSPGAGVDAYGIRFGAGNNHIFDGNTVGNIEGAATSFAIWVEAGTGHSFINNNIGATSDRLFKNGFDFGAAGLYFEASGSGSLVQNNVIGNTRSTGGANVGGCMVVCRSAGASGITFNSNYIGTDISLTKVAGLAGGTNMGGAPWAGFYCYASSGCQTITNNIIANNGWTDPQTSHGLAIWATTLVGGPWTISGNYIGVGPAGQDLGNGDAGIEILATTPGSVYNITGNYIGFNRGLRANGASGCRFVAAQTINFNNNYVGTLPGGRLNCGNYLAGVAFEGVTAGQVTMMNNTFAYNKTYGVYDYKGSTDKIYLSQNCFLCNTWEGIEWSSSDGGTANTGYGRTFATTADGARYVSVSPQGTYAAWESNLSGATWVLRGWAPAGSAVEIFQNHHCGCNTSTAFSGTGAVRAGQGSNYVATVTADAGGRWTYNLPQNTVKDGFTVTASNGVVRTSEFSPCYASPISCLQPLTVSATGSGTGSGGAISGTPIAPCTNSTFTTSGSATFIRPSCYDNTYYTWYKGATIVYGPSLTYSDYVKTLAANPADDGNYTLRVEDGNTGVASCYLTSSNVVVDVVVCTVPVEWLSFYGVNSGDLNKLYWTTGVEIENEYFEVERSFGVDNMEFETIARISTKGSGFSYNYNDNEFSKGKKNYYRIKQVDLNGNATYSEIIAINTDMSLDVKLYPNPAGNSATLSLVSDGDSRYGYLVTDICGRLLLNDIIEVSKGISSVELDFNYLTNGIYVVSLKDESGKLTNIKLTIQK